MHCFDNASFKRSGKHGGGDECCLILCGLFNNKNNVWRRKTFGCSEVVFVLVQWMTETEKRIGCLFRELPSESLINYLSDCKVFPVKAELKSKLIRTWGSSETFNFSAILRLCNSGSRTTRAKKANFFHEKLLSANICPQDKIGNTTFS